MYMQQYTVSVYGIDRNIRIIDLIMTSSPSGHVCGQNYL